MIVLVIANTVVLVLVVAAVVLTARRRRRPVVPPVDVLRRFDDAEIPTRVAEVITVEIRNHREVAATRTSLARPLASVAPRLVRSLVHQEACTIMRRELADQGVDADVRLRRLRLPLEETSGDPAVPGDVPD